MDALIDTDKSGTDLHRQRFAILEDIARELSNDAVFPTCFDISSVLDRELRDTSTSMDDLYGLIALEPLAFGRLRKYAAPSRTLAHEYDPKTIVTHLRSETRIRNLLAQLAKTQLMRSRSLATLGDAPRRFWIHSVRTACAAEVIARALTKLDPAMAYHAGLVHDIGVFYLNYRCTQYPELIARPDSLHHLIINWHESVGEMVLHTLDASAEIVTGIQAHDEARPPLTEAPRSLNEVIYAANLLGGGRVEVETDNPIQPILGDRYLALQPEIEKRFQSAMACLQQRS